MVAHQNIFIAIAASMETQRPWNRQPACDCIQRSQNKSRKFWFNSFCRYLCLLDSPVHYRQLSDTRFSQCSGREFHCLRPTGGDGGLSFCSARRPGVVDLQSLCSPIFLVSSSPKDSLHRSVYCSDSSVTILTFYRSHHFTTMDSFPFFQNGSEIVSEL